MKGSPHFFEWKLQIRISTTKAYASNVFFFFWGGGELEDVEVVQCPFKFLFTMNEIYVSFRESAGNVWVFGCIKLPIEFTCHRNWTFKVKCYLLQLLLLNFKINVLCKNMFLFDINVICFLNYETYLKFFFFRGEESLYSCWAWEKTRGRIWSDSLR